MHGIYKHHPVQVPDHLRADQKLKHVVNVSGDIQNSAVCSCGHSVLGDGPLTKDCTLDCQTAPAILQFCELTCLTWCFLCAVDVLRAKNLRHHRRLGFNNAPFVSLRQF